MSAQPLDLATELEEGERLKSPGVEEETEQERRDRHSRNQQDYQTDLGKRETEILEDIDAVLAHHGEVNIKYAVLTVIDDGDPLTHGAWPLDHVFPDVANDSRLRFADAVVQQLRRR